MTLTDFVITVENELGWTPKVNPKTPLWKARSIEAMKLKRAMTQNGVSLDDLRIALAYSKRKREACTPTALCWRVEEAKTFIAVAVTDIDEAVQQAIEWETEHDLADSERWITRFVRAMGSARAEALQDWRLARADWLNLSTAA